MTPAIRFSGPVDYGKRTIIPIIRDMTSFLTMDVWRPGILSDSSSWNKTRRGLFSLSEEVTITKIDELLGITEELIHTEGNNDEECSGDQRQPTENVEHRDAA